MHGRIAVPGRRDQLRLTLSELRVRVPWLGRGIRLSSYWAELTCSRLYDRDGGDVR